MTDELSPAVFVDRDGTIMKDCDYCSDPKDVRIFPGVPEALRRLKARGFKLIVITNQSGIGRGYFEEETFWKVQAAFEQQAGPEMIDATYFCADHPDEATDRRKPGPGMLIEAANDLGLNLAACFMVGDSASDVEAGLRAGVKATILIGTKEKEPREGVWMAGNFSEAVEFILIQGA